MIGSLELISAVNVTALDMRVHAVDATPETAMIKNYGNHSDDWLLMNKTKHGFDSSFKSENGSAITGHPVPSMSLAYVTRGIQFRTCNPEQIKLRYLDFNDEYNYYDKWAECKGEQVIDDCPSQCRIGRLRGFQLVQIYP